MDGHQVAAAVAAAQRADPHGHHNKEIEESLYGIFARFSEASTSHGLPRIFTSKSYFWKVNWLLVFLAFTSICCWQVWGVFDTFYSYPVSVSISIRQDTEVEFPSVTICNMNALLRSKIHGTRFGDLTDISDSADVALQNNTCAHDPENPMCKQLGGGSDSGGGVASSGAPAVAADPNQNGNPTSPNNQATQPPTPPASSGRRKRGIQAQQRRPGPAPAPGPNNNQDNLRNQISSNNDYWGLLYASQVSDFTDISSFLTPTVKEIQDYGYQYKDFVLQCSFNQEECSPKDFLAVQNRKHGMCYTFNWGRNGSIKTTTQYGVQSGLKLTLDPNEGEYIGMFSPEAGARVLVHRPYITPYPEELGVVAVIGGATSISMKQKKIKKMPAPYGKSPYCIDKAPPSYSVMNCTKDCLYDKISAICGCEDRLVQSDWNKTCSFVNVTQNACLLSIYAQYHNKTITCPNCRELCQETSYVTQSSVSNWPHDNYWGLLLLKESLRNTTTTNATWLTNKTDIVSGGLIRLNIFFQEFSYEYIEESEAYAFERLMSDIGGTMGLYVGISFCTFYELVELIANLVMAIWKRSSAPKSNVITVKTLDP